MFNYENNVFMQEYGNGTGGGSGGSDGPVFDLGFAAPQGGFTFVPSNYQFTDPPRYYKANDPYYYEVDNIPLKQLHENCLWLRDQMVGLELNVTGVPLSKVIDLQPIVSNSDRLITVRPGKFIGRVNDAYAMSPLFDINVGPSIDIEREIIYKPTISKITDEAFMTMVGATVENLIYDNGLYNQYQTHAAELTTIPGTYQKVLAFNTGYLDSVQLTLAKLPKIKTAVWQQLSVGDNQQRAVDFTRRWQGVGRTSVVNVAEDLTVEIPPFSSADFMSADNLPYEPQVRIDLVYLYTHPIDSQQTYLARDGGDGSPEIITAPRLGVVKGAGGLLAAQNGALDITGGANIGSNAWVAQEFQNSKYYNASAILAGGQALALQAPLTDQAMVGVTNPPFPNLTTGLSFPSPDDLMNLAPLIADEALEESLATIGQSVLPICYVVVKKDASLIFDGDVIDIRPFMRTAELAYNERVGVAAATPPLSLANPATGKEEVYGAVQTVRNYMQEKLELLRTDIYDFLEDNIQIPRPTWTGQYQSGVIQGTSYQALPLLEANSAYNPPPGGIGSYAEVAELGGKVFGGSQDPVGGTFLRLAPGIYMLQGSTSMYAQNDSNSNTNWTIGLYDSVSELKIWPPTDGGFSIKARGYHDHGHSHQQSDGGVGWSTFITVTGAVEGGSPGYMDLSVRIAASNGSQTATIRNSLTVTRLSNIDGSAGPIGV